MYICGGIPVFILIVTCFEFANFCELLLPIFLYLCKMSLGIKVKKLNEIPLVQADIEILWPEILKKYLVTCILSLFYL